MKVKILTIFTLVLLISAALAPAAMALPCGTGTDSAFYGNPFLSPIQGAAGSSFTVTGTGGYTYANVQVWWDNDGTPVLLGTLVTSSSVLERGNYSGPVTVPAGAAVGTYSVGLLYPEIDTATSFCLPFTVVAAVRTDAYTPALAAQGETPSVLPSTGLMLLVPAAGLVSAAAGAAIFRKRRQ